MYLFCLLLFPLAFLYYVVSRFSAVKTRLMISFFAFVLAGVICAFRGFFMFRSPYIGGRLAYFYAQTVFTCAVFPLLAYCVFLLLSRDSWRTKIESCALFLLPFYAVYLPAEIFANAVPLPFFFLFVKPVLYLVMVIAISSEGRTLFNVIVLKRKACVVSALIILVEIALPALIETLWRYAFSAMLWGTLSAGYIILCALRTKFVFKLREELLPIKNTV